MSDNVWTHKEDISNTYAEANTPSVYTACKGHQSLLILTN